MKIGFSFFLFILLWVGACGVPSTARAQYYSWGRSPSELRWKQIPMKNGKIIFPDYYEKNAMRMAFYMDTLYTSISYGLTHRPLRMPLILHTENFMANGLAIWAPKRMEMELIPEVAPFAEPWHKQLSSHEFRHAAQYGNLYQGWMKPLGWFVGDQAGLLSSVLVPLWFLEGDAVQMETQAAAYGRALQPSFTLNYRAYLMEEERTFRKDKWFCGSYKDYIPSHYHLGYQMVAWSREKYGDDLWDRVIHYAVRNPYTIFPTHFALKKEHRISTDDLFQGTFDELRSYWASLPKEQNSGTIIPTPVTSYTTYNFPIVVNDSMVVAVKEDLDRFYRVVAVNKNTGEEHHLFHTGLINTPLTLRDGILYWSEYRYSVFWEQRVFSRVGMYNIYTGAKRTLRQRDNALYPTPLPDGRIATVGYRYEGAYELDLGNGTTFPFPDTISVHGLAYDDQTATLAFIGLSEDGMSLGRIDPSSGEITSLTAPSYVSILDLRAGAGKLVYKSIQSGKDEIHLYDLTENQESRLTTSRYGSFSPSAPTPDGEVLFTTFGLEGFRLAHQKIESDSLIPVSYAHLPDNVVNPARRKWDVVCIDSVSHDETVSDQGRRVKSYRQGLKLFNVHSWTPWYFNPFDVAQEDRVDVTFGVTAMSQNLLSNTFAHVAYGRMANHTDRFTGSLKYYGLAPKFELDVDYGGGKQLIYGAVEGSPLPESLDNQFKIALNTSLPMQLTSDYRLRSLIPSIEVKYLNALLYDKTSMHYKNGYTRVVSSLGFFEQVRMAKRDILPRWGYAWNLSAVSAPFNTDFRHLLSLWGRVYLPGPIRHHGVSLKGNIQYQPTGRYSFFYKDLYPRGAYYGVPAQRYHAVSVDYHLPLCYPDWGINRFVFIKRIRLKGYYDYANFLGMPSQGTPTGVRQTVTSYGGELSFDLGVFRLPVNNTVLGFFLYNPSDHRGVITGFNLALPL